MNLFLEFDLGCVVSAMETEEFFGILTSQPRANKLNDKNAFDGNARKDVTVDPSMKVRHL